MRPLIAGNWKMNGLMASLGEIDRLKDRIAQRPPACEILICPPAPLLAPLAETTRDSDIFTGGQDCHEQETGAHTGDISAEMLRDAGASYVIVGHSERRADHGEGDDAVAAKAAAGARAGLTPIICVGETRQQREAGIAVSVVEEQLSGSVPSQINSYVIAYEPIWAIGTGLTASAEDIREMHAAIRAHAGAGIRILYGGSVKPGNAAEILRIVDVDGALVGGASLRADDFAAIIEAA